VRVEAPFAVESYPTVHQMVSTVRARLSEGLGALDVLASLFPCGSITGAPKIRAMELIDTVERDARGAYCGAIGRIDPAGEAGTGGAAFNVAIRTLRLVPGENGTGRAVLGVGSAIVADSQWLPEWRECLVKGSFVRTTAAGSSPAGSGHAGVGALTGAGFDLIETMGASPGKGVALLGLHLDRIEASAVAFGFACDRAALQHAVEAMSADIDEPQKVRLMLARSGAFALEVGPMPPALPDPVPCALLRLPVDSGDWRLRHKTSDRGFYEEALEHARAAGASEALLLRDDGLVTEGSYTNVFVERDGVLLTPPESLGLLPGVLRRAYLMQGRAREATLTLDDLTGGFLIGNAVRGLMNATLDLPSPSNEKP
jgi:para-aminobenzoate synthetase/4-amino-4-deoxychorismate lyase